MTVRADRASVPRPLFLTGLFLLSAIWLIAMSFVASGHDRGMPPPMGDTQDYDNIALQILHGRGFAIDYTDPEWRRPYEQHNADGDYDEILSWNTPLEATTFRPPLLPLMMAATYRLFGRSFLAWRIVASIITAAGLALVCSVAWHAFGSRVALIASAPMLLSVTYVQYAANLGLMTEPLAVLLVGAIIATLFRFEIAPRYRTAILAGVALALLCLCRSFYLAAMPLAIAFVWWTAKRAGADRRRAAAYAAACLAAIVLVQLPWWIRNCLVTHRFMPLGTQAGVNMINGYSDLAVNHRGVWWPAKQARAVRYYSEATGQRCDGCDEAAYSRYAMRAGITWARQHPAMLPKLAYWKVSDSWLTMSETGFIAPVFWLALAAPLVLWRRRRSVDLPVTIAIFGFILLNFAVIAVTWSVGWRFVAPVEPLLAILVAVALTAVLFGDSAVAAD